MAQNVIPADQLVTEVKPIERCNNYAVLQSISCSPECKIVRQLLLDHPLSYALTATDDVPVVYLQQFWRMVAKVTNTKDTIKFMQDTQQITYIVDMVGYQGVVDKVSAFYTKYLAQPWQTMFKVFNRCLTTRTSGHDQTKINILHLFHDVVNNSNVDYAALLWWYFMANVFQKKVAIQYPRFIKLIITDVMMKFPKIPKRLEEDYHSIKDDILERDALAKATLLSLTLHKTALEAEARENIAKVQEKLDEEEIERIVKGEEGEESYASAFADCVFNDDVDDTGCKIEPGSHKEKLENIDDDVVEIEKETNVDDTSDKLLDEVVKEKEVNMSRSQEIRKEQKQTLIPSPIRSPRNVSALDKTISEELTADVSPTTATTSKILSKLKQKKKSFTHKARNLPGKFEAHGPKMIEELFRQHMQNTTLNLYPKPRSSTVNTSSADLQQQLYLTMKDKPQDQAADL
ncbi:hypothetical protein Tco_1055110 [Tanacetum coccineum]|uniref:Uncharacterized protein n=1 Tax=Tanacetum coccineum TaxID=301880 RepID=A0ABQ5H123_9ASTR